MQFNVPQFVNVEDKIAGPLTWKQLLWMIGMGAALMTLFSIFETGFALVVGVPVALLFIALAFYKPNGFPLTNFIFHGVLFLFRPKVAVWERPVKKLPAFTPTAVTTQKPPAEKKMLTDEKLKELARILDQEN